jgi:SPP1 family predicted phage head-tail adaptor
MSCVRVGGRHRVVCAGDLNKRISIQNRAIVPPVSGTPDFTETFSGSIDRWAAIQTVKGKTIFDGLNQRDREVTHEVFIRYESGVTSESWIIYNSRRFDIIDVEDLEERHEFLRILCTDKLGSAL